MDAAQALADLTEISSQIQSAVLFDEGGAVHGSTLARDSSAAGLAAAAARRLRTADELAGDGEQVTQLAAAPAEGRVVVGRDGSRRIAATTGRAPTVGLVFYDLKSCLRSTADEAEKPKRARRKQADVDA